MVKVISITPGNAERGLPTISALVFLVDGADGRPMALMAGAAVTALRTGAAAGVATDLLAPPDARVMAMIGAGAQAPAQIRAVAAVRQLEDVKVWSRSADRSRRLVEAMRAEFASVRFEFVDSVDAALEGAHVITCATRATAPLFAAARVTGRVHVNAMGSYRPDMIECPPSCTGLPTSFPWILSKRRVKRRGDLIQAIDQAIISKDRIQEIGVIDRPETDGIHGIAVFKSVGVAIQDWVIAREVFAAAQLLQPGLEEIIL